MNQSALHEIEAEQNVIGSIVIENDLAPEIVEIATPADFYSPACRLAYEEALKLFNRGERFHLLQLDHHLGSSPGRASASEIAGWVEKSLPSMALQDARLIKKASSKRQVMALLLPILNEEIYSPTCDAEELVARLAAQLTVFQNGGSPVKRFMRSEELSTEALKLLEELCSSESTAGVSTSLSVIDSRLGGLPRGALIIVAGRPGMGKTSFCLTVIIGSSLAGFPAAFVSVESSRKSIIFRMLSALTGIENRRIQMGKLTDYEIRKVVAAKGAFDRLPIFVLDGVRSWDEIKTRLRGLKLAEPKLSLVCIDYLGLVKNSGSYRERYREIGAITADCKTLAVELDVALILASQLNRPTERRENHRPEMSDLRESGDIEQDADMIFFLYRPSYYDPEYEPRNHCELIIAKNREGIAGRKLDLSFDETICKFADLKDPLPVRDITGSKNAAA